MSLEAAAQQPISCRRGADFCRSQIGLKFVGHPGDALVYCLIAKITKLSILFGSLRDYSI